MCAQLYNIKYSDLILKKSLNSSNCPLNGKQTGTIDLCQNEPESDGNEEYPIFSRVPE